MIEITPINIGSFKTWLDVKNARQEDAVVLQEEYGLTQDVMDYAMDIDEPSNYDYDKKSKSQLFIYHLPYKTQQGYLTIPVAILLKGSLLITLTHFSDDHVEDIFRRDILKKAYTNINLTVLKLLKHLSDVFSLPTHELRRRRKELNDLLSERAENKHLIELANLRKSLIYFASSSQNNYIMLQNLKNKYFSRTFHENESEFLIDAQIEANQVQQLVEMESKIVAQLIATFDTILSNNLNGIMKLLTIWSVVLAIPTIITGFYGMNVSLPLIHAHMAWIIIVGITFILILWVLMVLHRHRII
ncbi:magnesium transporter CorA family protein [Liquorilactobacillus oeni]|uniref:Mg2 transporter protein CorA family protein n=1 Tax=Liquorilactobacillus oeni DSM 19972 TaxID=1423777 RepID=A0A0R1M8E0_9LACO|nr:magnesium transporter CorA family protein [Liquorilactobacillus oeni]KRL04471.1 Mg2 transporter protein CorA family protein [Liquorilactobacillus oeni DSM 19972]